MVDRDDSFHHLARADVAEDSDEVVAFSAGVGAVLAYVTTGAPMTGPWDFYPTRWTPFCRKAGFDVAPMALANTCLGVAAAGHRSNSGVPAAATAGRRTAPCARNVRKVLRTYCGNACCVPCEVWGNAFRHSLHQTRRDAALLIESSAGRDRHIKP